MRPELLTHAFAQAPFAMALLETAAPYRLLAANEFFAAEIAAGESLETIRGRTLFDLLPSSCDGSLEGALRRAAAGTSQTLLEFRAGTPRSRYVEITLSAVANGHGVAALLYLSRDVTDAESGRRRLEVTNERLSALAAVARETIHLAPERVTGVAARSAATLCDGAAAVYLLDARGELTRAASVGMPATACLPQRATRTRLPAAWRAMYSGDSETCAFGPAATAEDRAILAAVRASWLVATPIAGRVGACGAILTCWRRSHGPSRDDLRSLALVAGQVALAIEHAALNAVAERERARLDLILESMPESVWLVDADGTLARTNSAGRRLLGIDGGAPLPRADALSRRFAPDVGAASDDALGLRRALAGETVHHLASFARQSAPAREIWLDSSAAPLRAAGGAVVGAVGITNDMTERRRAEEAVQLLAQASAELGATLDYHRSLASVARLAVLLKLADWCVVDLLEPDGTTTRLPVAYPEATAAAVAGDLQRRPSAPEGIFAEVLAAKEVRAYSRHVDWMHAPFAVDAEQRRILDALQPRSMVLAPIVARGCAYGVMQLVRTSTVRPFGQRDVALAQDLARRAATAIDNVRLIEEARAADRRKDEFLGVLSHELRTPLTSVMVWAGILRHDVEPARIRHAADVIERNIRIQTALINDLLDLTSISRGKMKLDFTRGDLRQILDSAVEIVQQQAESNSIRLVRERSPQPLPVRGDAKRLQQVLWNILTNAIKFTPPEGIITIRATRERGEAVVRIRDTGEGISPEFLPHVFDMFRQQSSGERRTRPGLGIGLALGKQLVDLHGGRISAASAGRGRGSEFTVRLALLSPAGENASATDDAPECDPLADLAVLVVEDVRDITIATAALLESHGARVVTARNGFEALEKLRAERVDLVLCDLWMPVMDGFTFASEVRRDGARAHLPIVAVSGLAGTADATRIHAAGFDAFVRKPFDDEGLLDTLRRVLSVRSQAGSREAASACAPRPSTATEKAGRGSER